MQDTQPWNLQNERKAFLSKRHGSHKYWNIVKITAYVCKRIRVFRGLWEKLSKRKRNAEYTTKTLLWGKLKL